MEYVVRQRLYRTGRKIAGLYAGNPQRGTQRPTTEMLLNAFCGITLTRIEYSNLIQCHLTPLTPLQERILRLLGFSKSVYMQLTVPLVNEFKTDEC